MSNNNIESIIVDKSHRGHFSAFTFILVLSVCFPEYAYTLVL